MLIKVGTLRAFGAGAYTATVEFAASAGTWLGGIAVARNIAAGELLAGRYVAILFGEAGNPDAAVVIAVWV